jgi:hypothetical protein
MKTKNKYLLDLLIRRPLLTLWKKKIQKLGKLEIVWKNILKTEMWRKKNVLQRRKQG